MDFRVVGLSAASKEGILIKGSYSKDEHTIVSAERRVRGKQTIHSFSNFLTGVNHF
jgi:hypothetical protein